MSAVAAIRVREFGHLQEVSFRDIGSGRVPHDLRMSSDIVAELGRRIAIGILHAVGKQSSDHDKPIVRAGLVLALDRDGVTANSNCHLRTGCPGERAFGRVGRKRVSTQHLLGNGRDPLNVTAGILDLLRVKVGANKERTGFGEHHVRAEADRVGERVAIGVSAIGLKNHVWVDGSGNTRHIEARNAVKRRVACAGRTGPRVHWQAGRCGRIRCGNSRHWHRDGTHAGKGCQREDEQYIQPFILHRFLRLMMRAAYGIPTYGEHNAKRKRDEHGIGTSLPHQDECIPDYGEKRKREPSDEQQDTRGQKKPAEVVPCRKPIAGRVRQKDKKPRRRQEPAEVHNVPWYCLQIDYHGFLLYFDFRRLLIGFLPISKIFRSCGALFLLTGSTNPELYSRHSQEQNSGYGPSENP